jgi:AraC family transcriptional regulator, dual regulator of chb operon
MLKTLSLKHLPTHEFCTYAKRDFSKAQQSMLHDHDFHELFWIEEGQGWHWVNGQKRSLESGDLILVRASDVHGFSAMKDGGHMRIVNFAFFADIWTHFLERYFSKKRVFFEVKNIEKREYNLSADQLSALRHAARDLDSGTRDRFSVERFLFDVLGILRKSPSPLENHRTPPWIREACEKIRQNGSFQGGTLKLSKLACRTPEHVAREFKRYLNKTPTEVVNEARMSYAAMKLATSNEEIVQIAFDCGIENLSHFYHLFRVRYGMSPRAYRVEQQSVLNPKGLRS